MNDNGLKDETVQEYLELIENDLNALKYDLPVYTTNELGRNRLEPLEIVLEIRNLANKVAVKLSDYEIEANNQQ